MRSVAPLVFALALIAPLSLIGFSSGDAQAKPRKRSHAASKSRAKKPVIQLNDSAVPGSVDEPQASADAPPPSRGPTRIDFDDRLVQGQTNKSGAVYLYDRKELKTRSMVKKRESFREEIITAVYDSE